MIFAGMIMGITLSLDKIAAVCNLTVEEVKELTMQPA